MQDYEPNLPGDNTELIQPVEQTKSSKNLNKLIYLALIIIASILGLLAYWTLQPSDPLTINNAPFPVRTIRQEATADGVIILTVDYCKTSNASGTVRTSFVSASREVFLPASEEHIPKGCNKTEVPVIVPKDIVPDTYKIRFHVTYTINPLKRDAAKDFESEPMTIVKQGDPGSLVILKQP